MVFFVIGIKRYHGVTSERRHECNPRQRGSFSNAQHQRFVSGLPLRQFEIFPSAVSLCSKRRFLATALTFIGSRKQLVDLAVWMAVDDPGEHIGETGKRVGVVQFASFDQGGDSGPMLGAAVGACERRIFPVERNMTDGAFDGIVVDHPRRSA